MLVWVIFNSAQVCPSVRQDQIAVAHAGAHLVLQAARPMAAANIMLADLNLDMSQNRADLRRPAAPLSVLQILIKLTDSTSINVCSQLEVMH